MAKKQKIKKKEEDIYFVGLTNQEELKRKILESSKGLLESLKSFEDIKNIRKEKKDNIENLKKITKETSLLIRKIKSYLPKVHPLMKQKFKKTEEIVVKEERPADIPSQVDRLQAELDDIEKKLNSLG